MLAAPFWQLRQTFGYPEPNWVLFLRYLFSDWNDQGQWFTWMSSAHLWWLKNEALLVPARSTYRATTEDELSRMTLGQVTTLIRWQNKLRKQQADEYKREVEKAKAEARSGRRR